MRPLLAFVNFMAMAWVGSEAFTTAANGNLLPALLLVLTGIVAFAVVGCLTVKRSLMNLGVLAFVGAMVLCGLFFAIQSFGTSPLAGIAKLVAVALMVGTNFIAFNLPDETDAH